MITPNHEYLFVCILHAPKYDLDITQHYVKLITIEWKILYDAHSKWTRMQLAIAYRTSSALLIDAIN